MKKIGVFLLVVFILSGVQSSPVQADHWLYTKPVHLGGESSTYKKKKKVMVQTTVPAQTQTVQQVTSCPTLPDGTPDPKCQTTVPPQSTSSSVGSSSSTTAPVSPVTPTATPPATTTPQAANTTNGNYDF